MCKIILPIHSKYSNDLLSGKKDFEIRRSIPKSKVDEILIYETSPTSKIVGTIKVKETHKMSIKNLWNYTKNKNSLSKKEFLDYFSGKDYGYAFEVEEYKRFKKPKDLNHYDLSYPPQSFAYVKN